MNLKIKAQLANNPWTTENFFILQKKYYLKLKNLLSNAIKQLDHLSLPKPNLLASFL